MSKGSTRPRSIGICSKLGPHELLFHTSVHDRQLVLERGLDLHAADAEAAVADDDDHLLARARELGADAPCRCRGRPAPAVRRRRSGPGSAPPSHCESQPESVKLSTTIVASGSITSSESRATRRGMDRHRAVHLRLLRAQRAVELVRTRSPPRRARRRRGGACRRRRARRRARRAAGARASDRRRSGRRRARASRSRDGVASTWTYGRVGVPRRRLAEVLAAPEPEADREDHVGAARERLLPRAAHGERVVLRHGALRGAAGVDRNLQAASASARSSAAASDQKTPSPATISGRSARASASSARSIAAGSPALRSASGG